MTDADLDAHDLVIVDKYGGTLMVDRQRRGGLMLQICAVRDGQEEWNPVWLTKRQADALRKFLTGKATP